MSKFRVLDLRGKKPQDQGRCHGEELRDDIVHIRKVWIDALGQLFGIRTARIKHFLIERFCALYDLHTPKKFLEEMRGIAEASRVPYPFIRFINNFDEAYRYLMQRPTRGCSAIAGQDAFGNVIAGGNVDFGTLVAELGHWRTVLRYDNFASVQPCPGFIGVYQGMNNRGMFLTMHACNTKKAYIAMPRAFITRQMLDAKNRNAALHIVENVRKYTVGTLILLGDTYEISVLEIAPRRVAHRKIKNLRPFAITNHFEHETMLSKQASEYWTLGCEIKPFTLTQAWSGIRQERLHNYVSKFRALTPEIIQNGLKTVAHNGTVQTVVYEPAQRVMWIATGKHPAAFGQLEPYYLDH